MAPTAPMTDVFLDTGFVVALSDRTDRHHQEAREHAEQISQEEVHVVLSDGIVLPPGRHSTPHLTLPPGCVEPSA
jgi:hypothetical protein